MTRARKRSHRALGLACALWLLVGTAACGDPVVAACLTSCERLLKCGFLPSVLAPKSDNSDDLIESCAERCSASDSDFVGDVHGCVAAVRLDNDKPWCGYGDKGSACETASACLHGLVGEGTPIIGQASLKVEARINGPFESSTDSSACDGATQAADEPSVAENLTTLPTDWCGSAEDETQGSVRAVEFIASQRDQPLPPVRYDSCPAAMERGASFTLEPGPVQVSIRIEGVGGECRQYRAPEHILWASASTEISVFLPSKVGAVLRDDADKHECD